MGAKPGSQQADPSKEAMALRRLVNNRHSASKSRERAKVRYNAMAAGMAAVHAMLDDGSLQRAAGVQLPPEIAFAFSELVKAPQLTVCEKGGEVDFLRDQLTTSEMNARDLHARLTRAEARLEHTEARLAETEGSLEEAEKSLTALDAERMLLPCPAPVPAAAPALPRETAAASLPKTVLPAEWDVLVFTPEMLGFGEHEAMERDGAQHSFEARTQSENYRCGIDDLLGEAAAQGGYLFE